LVSHCIPYPWTSIFGVEKIAFFYVTLRECILPNCEKHGAKIEESRRCGDTCHLLATDDQLSFGPLHAVVQNFIGDDATVDSGKTRFQGSAGDADVTNNIGHADRAKLYLTPPINRHFSCFENWVA